MAAVLQKFVLASVLMWAAPVAILFGFNHNLFPGIMDMDSHTLTLLSGFLAVLSVNIVIALYVWLAMKEPSDKFVPDPKFLAAAKASVNQANMNEDQSSSSQPRDKNE